MGTAGVHRERHAARIDHDHDFGAFAFLGGADIRAPFFAALKVPSMKTSRGSKSACSSLSSASAVRIVRNPCRSTHSWNRSWKVALGGHSPVGMAAHCPPVCRTQKLPSSTSRSERRGRPRVVRVVNRGIRGAKTARWAALSRISRVCRPAGRHTITRFPNDL